MGLLDYFADFKKKRKMAETADWIKYRAGEQTKPLIDAPGGVPHVTEWEDASAEIKEKANSIMRRSKFRDMPSDNRMSGLAQYIRKPRLWQGK